MREPIKASQLQKSLRLHTLKHTVYVLIAFSRHKSLYKKIDKLKNFTRGFIRYFWYY